MSNLTIGECMAIVEGVHQVIRWPSRYDENAAAFFVSRLFTDAIFNQDVRAIATIIQRVDGGLPKDIDVALIRTEFSDCVNELMEYDHISRTKIFPSDTIMMCLAKSLYDLAVEDIYWDEEEGRPKKPSDTKKQLRDNARRIILERAGGRKTLKPREVEVEQVELSPWIVEALPGK